jgi:hypothetical protein
LNLLEPHQQQGGKNYVGESQFKENHPAQSHELVVAEAGERPSHRYEEKDKKDHFREESSKVNKTMPERDFGINAFRGEPAEREAPTTKEESHGEA